jgi:hypothetical protein
MTWKNLGYLASQTEFCEIQEQSVYEPKTTRLPGKTGANGIPKPALT